MVPGSEDCGSPGGDVFRAETQAVVALGRGVDAAQTGDATVVDELCTEPLEFRALRVRGVEGQSGDGLGTDGCGQSGRSPDDGAA